MKPQTVRQGEATLYWFKLNLLSGRSKTGLIAQAGRFMLRA